MGEITRHAFRCKLLWGAIRTILLIGPIVGAFIYALATGQIESKYTLVFGVSFAFTILICLVNLVCKFHLRTPGWLFMFICLWLVHSTTIVIVIIGIGTILDEIIAEPFYRHYKDFYKYNKNHDKREKLIERYRIKDEEQKEVPEG